MYFKYQGNRTSDIIYHKKVFITKVKTMKSSKISILDYIIVIAAICYDLLNRE